MANPTAPGHSAFAEEQYELRRREDFGPSWSIREHLPLLRAIADECDSAFELGVCHVVSTWAFLTSRLRSLTSVDVVHPDTIGGDIGAAERAAVETGTDFRFIQASTLDVPLHDVDLTFIDTFHVYEQLLAELRRFAPYTRRYIVLHDTETFGVVGENGVSRGLRPAVDEFLAANPSWYLRAHFTNNNGLTVLERRPGSIRVLAVTGFVDNAFPARHLRPGEARAYGQRLKDALGERVHAFDEGWSLRDCWAHRLLEENPGLLPSDIDPPADRFVTPHDAVRSNIVLMQRFEWMRRAAEERPDIDVFAWIEYTVLKQRGVTESVLRSFLDTLEHVPVDSITLPGMWPKAGIDDRHAHWRFAGSCWVAPRSLLEPLADTIKDVASLRARRTGRLSWDMNTMAYVELLDVLPIRWYAGDHDETQFTGFGAAAARPG